MPSDNYGSGIPRDTWSIEEVRQKIEELFIAASVHGPQRVRFEGNEYSVALVLSEDVSSEGWLKVLNRSGVLSEEEEGIMSGKVIRKNK